MSIVKLIIKLNTPFTIHQISVVKAIFKVFKIRNPFNKIPFRVFDNKLKRLGMKDYDIRRKEIRRSRQVSDESFLSVHDCWFSSSQTQNEGSDKGTKWYNLESHKIFRNRFARDFWLLESKKWIQKFEF